MTFQRLEEHGRELTSAERAYDAGNGRVAVIQVCRHSTQKPESGSVALILKASLEDLDGNPVLVDGEPVVAPDFGLTLNTSILASGGTTLGTFIDDVSERVVNQLLNHEQTAIALAQLDDLDIT